METSPLILAIDTSCDDTSASVTRGLTVLSNVIASQTELHKPYGGVFPTVAKQAHKENIAPTMATALKRAGVEVSEIDAVAVTQGPGLAPALEVGIAYAKDLAEKHSIPLLAVNHIEGHVLSVLAQPKPTASKQVPADHTTQSPEQQTKAKLSEIRPNIFPALSIIVSGGHTQFVLVSAIGEYQVLGATLDDAAGECLDKIGRMLNLGYPAGPVIEKFAKLGDQYKYEFPLPMTQSHDYNMSFSGMKTFARNKLTELEADTHFKQQDIFDFCASAQYGVYRAIMYKLSKVLVDHPVQSVWLGGGVAANTKLRQMIRQTIIKHEKNTAAAHNAPRQKIEFLTPYTKKLCMDNAAMIGVVAGAHALHSQQTTTKIWHKLTTNSAQQLERQPRLSL